jgi:hypothetical protein
MPEPTTLLHVTKPLAAMDAAELTEALRRHFAAAGGMAGDTEREIARELVRRARRAEWLDAKVRELTFLLWKRDQG